MSDQLALTRDVGRTRDPLDRYFTPQALADLIVQRVIEPLSSRTTSMVVEPHVGGGAFARAIQRDMPWSHLVGVDIDSEAEGRHHVDDFVCADWLTLNYSANAAHIIVGNPPFTGTTAIAHVRRCLEVADTVALILPWAPLGGVQAWDDLLDGTYRPSMVMPIVPRPWPASVREVALYVWDRTGRLPDGRDTIVRRLPRWR